MTGAQAFWSIIIALANAIIEIEVKPSYQEWRNKRKGLTPRKLPSICPRGI